MENFSAPIQKDKIAPVEMLPGIYRRTLAYNKESLLAHFELKKGSHIPLHQHIHVQNGYVIQGKIRFFTEKGEFIASPGESYVFNGNEKHGADVLENSEIIEIFVPCRVEYIPK
jgi:quercetin dioxygenase-like cupin family protein